MDELEEFSITFVAKSPKATLMRFDDDERWVPNSLVDEDLSDEFEKDCKGVVYIKKWWADKEGFSAA